MAKRKKATQAFTFDRTKQVSNDQLEIRYFVGDTEYSRLPDALRRSGVGTKLGLPEGFTNFAGSAIYAYLRSHRDKFSSYLQIGSATLFPYSEVKSLIDDYAEKLGSRVPATRPTESPEVQELLNKLRENPDLAKALLEIVA